MGLVSWSQPAKVLMSSCFGQERHWPRKHLCASVWGCFYTVCPDTDPILLDPKSPLQVFTSGAMCSGAAPRPACQGGLGCRCWQQAPKQGSGLMYFCLCYAINVAVGNLETSELLAFIDMDCSSPITRHTLNCTEWKHKQPFANECFLPLCSDWSRAWHSVLD